MNPIPLIEQRTQITGYGKDLFRICGIEFAKTTEMQRQVCGTFLFGVTFVQGKLAGLAQPDVQALSITMLIDVLNYSAAQAGALSTRLIQAATAGPDDTMKAIIHRGIDGHRQLTDGNHDGLRQNLLGIFKALGDPYVA